MELKSLADDKTLKDLLAHRSCLPFGENTDNDLDSDDDNIYPFCAYYKFRENSDKQICCSTIRKPIVKFVLNRM